MENKYKKRAKDILCLRLYPNRTEEEHKLDTEGLYDGNTIADNTEIFLNAMCQLAEEIYDKAFDDGVNCNISIVEDTNRVNLVIAKRHGELIKSTKNLYAKKQVEESLQEKEISIRNEKDKEFIELRNNKQIFTKKDMEELLQKQRELCAKKVRTNATMYHKVLNAKLKLDGKL